MNAGEVTIRIEAYVREHFNVSSRDGRFGATVDLFEGGYVDSIGLVELLEFIESEFGVQISDEDLLSDEFATLEGIGRIVRERAA
jgi:acyl carrier protein